MLTKVARSLGDTEQRLYEVSLWREVPFYTDRARAALAWIEAVTRIHLDHVPDDLDEMVRQHFDEKGAGRSHDRVIVYPGDTLQHGARVRAR
jgi:alkylhydroperoxidase family enzyme